MRPLIVPSLFPVLLAASLILSGCTSSSSPEGLIPGVASKETTNSVNRAAPVPSASVGDVIAKAEPQSQEHELAWAAPDAQSQAFVTIPERSATPLADDMKVAMLVPAVPAIDAQQAARGAIYSQRFRDAKPINFGKASPRNHAVHGVDVSRWQGEMDWVKLRTQGANFAFIKATDGGDHLDPMFKTNWRRAKEAGIRRGAYHFFYWCRTAGEQADWFIRNVPKEPGALPPVIDVEYNGESSCKFKLSRAKTLEKMQVFMDKLERHYGQRPIIYTAPDFYADKLQGEFKNYPFWLRSVAAHPSKRYPDRKWLFWQYSGSGLSQGVNGKIDLNVFHGSERDWHKWVAKAT